ncbi:hypothetical protein BG000_000521 [Podila horticola]|nr:hypothetical protein BG000_000521 [Podila horticola]
MTPSDDCILIIGAGLGGLALAQGLKKAGISFRVFERDISADFRPQGYRVRINPFGGAALKETLDDRLFELFEKTCAEIRMGMTGMNAINATENPPELDLELGLELGLDLDLDLELDPLEMDRSTAPIPQIEKHSETCYC